MVLRRGRFVPVYGARKDKVNIERGGRGYCIVILFKLGQVIGRAYKYLECNGCPRSPAGFHAFSYVHRNLPWISRRFSAAREHAYTE